MAAKIKNPMILTGASQSDIKLLNTENIRLADLIGISITE